MTTAFWRALHTPGHDAARLEPDEDGWRLSGAAAFLHDGRPTQLAYEVILAADWTTRSGRIAGFCGETAVDRRILREGSRWSLDGIEAPELDDLVDLDFGFTPATNLQQLRRAALKIGGEAEIPAAWLDVEGDLARLPQTYRRIDEDSYAYESPTVGYAATLVVAPDGFVREYPTLWRRLA